MFKFIKFLFKLILALVVVLAVAMIGLFLFVNPNQFKGNIEQQVLAKTGQTLKLQGPISWRWTPMLSLSLEDVSFENAPTFKGKMLVAKTINAEMDLASLFKGKVFINLNLDGIQLNLIKNNAGEYNWKPLLQHLNNEKKEKLAQNSSADPKLQTEFLLLAKASTELPTNSQTPNTSTDASSSIIKGKDSSQAGMMQLPVQVEINHLKIKDANINFLDEASHQSYKIENLKLSVHQITEALRGNLKPLDLNLSIIDPNSAGLNKISLNVDWALLTNKDELQFKNFILKLNLPNHQEWVLKGHIQIAHLSKNPSIEGNVIGNNLQYNKIVIDEIKANFNAKQDSVKIEPIDISIAQGMHHASVEANLSKGIPTYNIVADAKDFEIKSLLSAFDVHNKIEGKTAYHFKLTAAGTNKKDIQRTLNGQTELSIQNGQFFGADLIKLIKNAQGGVHTMVSTLTQKQGFSFKSSLQNVKGMISDWEKGSIGVNAATPFNTIHATTKITNGLINNPDLNISHSEYQVNGSGSVNLVNNEVQYNSSLTLKNNPYPAEDKLGHYLYQTPLPVKVQGTIQDLIIRPDLKTYTNSAIHFAEENLVKKMMEKTINKAVNKGVEKVVEKGVTKALEKGVSQKLGEQINKNLNGKVKDKANNKMSDKISNKVNQELQNALGNILNNGQ